MTSRPHSLTFSIARPFDCFLALARRGSCLFAAAAFPMTASLADDSAEPLEEIEVAAPKLEPASDDTLTILPSAAVSAASIPSALSAAVPSAISKHDALAHQRGVMRAITGKLDDDHGDDHGGSHGGHSRNHFAGFVGITALANGDHTDFTLGIDYEYRLSEHYGVGFIFEHAFGELDLTSFFGVVDYHITEGFVVQAGPGIEFEEGKEFFAFKVGAYYETTIFGYTLSPSIAYDFSEGEDAFVIGALFGLQF